MKKKKNVIDLDLNKFYQVNWKAIYVLYVLIFIHTLIILCTVSEILAEIDHWGPNWTFLTLKMTFRVIPYLLYFMTWLVAQQRSYIMQYIWAELCYYWITSIIMGKWATYDLSDLENDVLMKSIFDSWSISSPRNCIYKNERKIIRPLLRKLAKSSKTAKFDLFQTFRTLKNDLSSDSIKSICWQFNST